MVWLYLLVKDRVVESNVTRVHEGNIEPLGSSWGIGKSRNIVSNCVEIILKGPGSSETVSKIDTGIGENWVSCIILESRVGETIGEAQPEGRVQGSIDSISSWHN